MAEYIVTSGSHTVTKDGTPLGGSPYGTDQLALQAAHDDGADDDVIKLAQQDASTKFQLGAAEQLLMSKAMPVEGIVEAGVKPAIVGGKRAIEFSGVGKNASFKDIKMENGSEFGLQVRKSANVTIDGVEVETDTAQNRYGDNPNPVFIGVIVGGSENGSVFDSDVSGNVSVVGVKINTEAGADEEDPYDGDRQLINPAAIGDGGAWPGAGFENPGAWKAFGISCGYIGGSARIQDCQVRNQSVHGVTCVDVKKEVEVRGNRMQSWYGIHNHGSSAGGFGYMIANGIGSPSLTLDASFRKRNGFWDISENEITVLGRTNSGGLCFCWEGGCFRPYSVAIHKNVMLAEGSPGFMGFGGWGMDRGIIVRNTVKGSGAIGIYTGYSTPGIIYGTRNLAILNNDLSQWAAPYKYFSNPEVQGSHIYPLGVHVNQGTRNVIFG